jgi:hypothetical protein
MLFAHLCKHYNKNFFIYLYLLLASLEKSSVNLIFFVTKIRFATKIIKKYFNCYIWCYGLSPSCIAISADSLKLA